MEVVVILKKKNVKINIELKFFICVKCYLIGIYVKN